MERSANIDSKVGEERTGVDRIPLLSGLSSDLSGADSFTSPLPNALSFSLFEQDIGWVS